MISRARAPRPLSTRPRLHDTAVGIVGTTQVTQCFRIYIEENRRKTPHTLRFFYTHTHLTLHERHSTHQHHHKETPKISRALSLTHDTLTHGSRGLHKNSTTVCSNIKGASGGGGDVGRRCRCGPRARRGGDGSRGAPPHAPQERHSSGCCGPLGFAASASAAAFLLSEVWSTVNLIASAAALERR